MSSNKLAGSKWTSSAKMQSMEIRPVGISSSSLQRRADPRITEKSSFSGLNRQAEVYLGLGVSKPTSLSGGAYLQDIGRQVHNQHVHTFKERYNTQSVIANPQLSGIPVYIDRNMKTQQNSQRLSRDRLGSNGSLQMNLNSRESPQLQKPLPVEVSSKIVAASKPSVQLLTAVKKPDSAPPGNPSAQHFSWLWKERHPQAVNVLQAKALKSIDTINSDHYLQNPEQFTGVGPSKSKLDALVKNVQPQESQHTIYGKGPSVPIKARKGDAEDFPTKEYASQQKDGKDVDLFARHVISSGQKASADKKFIEPTSSSKRVPGSQLRSSTPGLHTPGNDLRKRSSSYESMNQAVLNSSERYLAGITKHDQHTGVTKYQRLYTLGVGEARTKLLGCIDRVGKEPGDKRKDTCEVMNLLREFNFNEGLVGIVVEALVSARLRLRSGLGVEDSAGPKLSTQDYMQKDPIRSSQVPVMKTATKNLQLKVAGAADSPPKKFPMFSAPSSPHSPAGDAGERYVLKDTSKILEIGSERLEQSSEFSLPPNLPLEDLNKMRMGPGGEESPFVQFTGRESDNPSRIGANANYGGERVTESEHQLAEVWGTQNPMDFARRKSNPRPASKNNKRGEDEKLRTYQSEPKIVLPIKKMAKSFVENPLDEEDSFPISKR